MHLLYDIEREIRVYFSLDITDMASEEADYLATKIAYSIAKVPAADTLDISVKLSVALRALEQLISKCEITALVAPACDDCMRLGGEVIATL